MIFASVAVASTASNAAETEYSTWGNDTGSSDDLVNRLNELIDEAEKARAADPRFLRDLREALESHDRPFQQELLFDNFRDGEFSKNPTWTVAEGRFSVDSRLGLKTLVEPPRAASTSTTTAPKKKKKDLASSLLGALLSDDSGKSSSSSTVSTQADRAEIFSATEISNAFSLEIDLTSSVEAGRLSLSLFQGRNRTSGYRLAYLPGGDPSFELIKFTSRGASVIDSSADEISLEDNARHRISISRDDQGEMVVELDGTELIRAADRSFRDPFDGISIINDGGNYVVSQIVVYGSS
jgi:hypothetical protein